MIELYSIIFGVTLLFVAACLHDRFIGVKIRTDKYLEKMARINESMKHTKEIY